jgi:sterol desaturase/sphingolipid hydroxylase (fatty acid hydroxylase superfamily)
VNFERLTLYTTSDLLIWLHSIAGGNLNKSASNTIAKKHKASKGCKNTFMLAIVYFVLAFILSSFVEYWVHRSLHVWSWLGNRLTGHFKHHYENKTSGVLGDFKDYSVGAVIFCPILLISWSAGISAILGGLFFAAFAAYTHKLQHEDPTKCFWMKVPVHHLHHQYSVRYNFGLSVDWWDKVFGTYNPMQWSSRIPTQPNSSTQ